MSVRGGMFLSSSLVAGGPVASAILYGGIEVLSERGMMMFEYPRSSCLMSVVYFLNVRGGLACLCVKRE